MTSETYDVFLSHDWGRDQLDRNNHTRVSKINDALKKAGFITWFDSDRMRGDIMLKMTEGIDNSKAVIVFITKNYIQKVAGNGERGTSDNCKIEFDYSCSRKTTDKMIAVVMEPESKNTSEWTGPVGALFCNKLYCDFTKDDHLKDCMEQIKEEFAIISGQNPAAKHAIGKRIFDESGEVLGIFDGQINVEGLREGVGNMKFINGNIYDGEFKNDLYNGHGELRHHGSGEYYKGDWKDGKMCGNGYQRFSSGAIFEGEFRDDLKHGKGVYRFPNGDKYDGSYIKDNREGYGIYTYKDGCVYEGTFQCNLRHGMGKFRSSTGDEYYGSWRNGLAHGRGVYRYVNGDSFEGGFLKDEKHGNFLYRFSDGGVKIGSYTDGRITGEGVVYNANRTKAVLLVDGEEKDTSLSLSKATRIAKRLRIVPSP
jgi:hypothetical protein